MLMRLGEGMVRSLLDRDVEGPDSENQYTVTLPEATPHDLPPNRFEVGNFNLKFNMKFKLKVSAYQWH